jgi:hypothetical protein
MFQSSTILRELVESLSYTSVKTFSKITSLDIVWRCGSMSVIDRRVFFLFRIMKVNKYYIK